MAGILSLSDLSRLVPLVSYAWSRISIYFVPMYVFVRGELVKSWGMISMIKSGHFIIHGEDVVLMKSSRISVLLMGGRRIYR